MSLTPEVCADCLKALDIDVGGTGDLSPLVPHLHLTQIMCPNYVIMQHLPFFENHGYPTWENIFKLLHSTMSDSIATLCHEIELAFNSNRTSKTILCPSFADDGWGGNFWFQYPGLHKRVEQVFLTPDNSSMTDVAHKLHMACACLVHKSGASGRGMCHQLIHNFIKATGTGTMYFTHAVIEFIAAEHTPFTSAFMGLPWSFTLVPAVMNYLCSLTPPHLCTIA